VRAFIQYTLNGLTVGSFYALVALGFTIVYGIVRLINFAHGALAMIGSFIGWTLLTSLSLTRLPPLIGIGVAFAGAMLGTALLMLLILRVAYRPMFKRRASVGILIVALGVAQLLENGAQLIFGATDQAFPDMLSGAGFNLVGIHFSYIQLALFHVSILLMIGLYLFIHWTTLGTAMRALAVDHDAARLMGIDVEKVIAIAFMLGAALAAASGVMIGLYYTQISFTMGFLLGLRAFTAAVLGGVGNIPGAMVGGLLIGLLESYCTGYLSGRWQDVFVFGVLIVLLVVRPTGLFGERIAERV
jgi:branched-chain amino acid transport system permease protein